MVPLREARQRHHTAQGHTQHPATELVSCAHSALHRLIRLTRIIRLIRLTRLIRWHRLRQILQRIEV
jgi:hypothetical protein